MATKTQIVGRIKFDLIALQRDLDALSRIPVIKEQYDEFSAGTWINHSIYNRSGEWKDTQYSDFEHPAVKTQIGDETPYLCGLIEGIFDFENMRMARVRNLVQGLVIPHVDFLELSEQKNRYIRILIPLETCLDSYHSEEGFGVFRMRKGDIWILESQLPHSAHNLGSDSRRILSIDFQYSDEDAPHYSRIFKDKRIHDESVKPALVQRNQLDSDDLHDYLQMLSVQLKGKYDAEQVMVKLSELQLRFESPVSDIYENLVTVAKMTGDTDLIRYCEDMRRFYLHSRVMDERFDLRPDLVAA